MTAPRSETSVAELANIASAVLVGASIAWVANLLWFGWLYGVDVWR